MTLSLTMDNNYENIITVKFAKAQQPKFEEKKGKGFIEFGENNDYPIYLLSLFNDSPKHGAIVKSKSNYIFGKGFDSLPQKANTKGESWNQVIKKCIVDDELYGGYYLQIIYNLLGKIKDVYHLEFHKVRTNKTLSEFKVKNDWSDNKEEARCYPAFNNTYSKEQPTQILFVKQYNPKSDIYPLPNYFQGLNYIESDIQVSRHILGNAKEGFVGNTLIEMNGGEPQEEQKAAVEKGLKKKFTGSEGERVVIVFNKSKDNSAVISQLGNTMLTKEDFTNVNLLIQQEIFACHQVTSPMLFGIKTEGQLGGRSEIRDAYEIFNNTYVNERQQAHEETFNTLFNLVGMPGEHKIIPVEPLGFGIKDDLLLDVMPREWFMDELGVDQKYYSLPPARTQPAAGVPATPANVDASGNPVAAVNENLAGMSGRKFQQLERIVRKYTSGKLTRDQAAMMLKNSFGISDDEVALFLDADSSNQQFATQDEIDFALIEQFSTVGEERNKFEVIGKKVARESEYFADVKELSQLEANILNLIKKDKRITSEVIAKTLKQDNGVVSRLMTEMEKSGILSPVTAKVGEDNVIERTVTDSGVKVPTATTTDILLRYSYEGPQDKKNRPFCAKLMELDRLYSRADIETISERLGYSVWDRRGGWFTQPDGEARPYCRHEWFAVTVIRKN